MSSWLRNHEQLLTKVDTQAASELEHGMAVKAIKVSAHRRVLGALSAAVLAGAAALVLAQAQPAAAATNQFKGVNWADTRDNYNTGWVIPDGLSASDTNAQVYAIANTDVKAFQANLGANTVRLPINPPSVSQSWWGA